ncbi:MAG: HugZ family protein [Gammaproteobacteria bacterium]|nr:HugZ family protein [Gammaproteobacteria bacterium]
MSENTELSEIDKELESFISGLQSLLMATVSDQGFPEISYASYIEVDRKFYIFISELASHTKNLLKNSNASVMFIEDESQASHSFARKRLTLTCEASRISRDNQLFEILIEKMQLRFGNLIETLRHLNDFHLFELRPLTGQYVAGFGKTYEINISTGQLKLLKPDI